ncbi:hypothetical protein GUJ93_ZPchr0013g36700 [Zizania palustris]|uniref:Uncharacterized protein n=1 Tax=Zizania palustris TaxID=103762 RepID=A0A8J5WYZ4_ZIZPA|nr:hypothetical protein GUJ93_ZPchr0013g36700 [Zizania palustris]
MGVRSPACTPTWMDDAWSVDASDDWRRRRPDSGRRRHRVVGEGFSSGDDSGQLWCKGFGSGGDVGAGHLCSTRRPSS